MLITSKQKFSFSRFNALSGLKPLATAFTICAVK